MNNPITLGDWTADLCRLPVKDKRVLAANIIRSLPDQDRAEVLAKLIAPPITREELISNYAPPVPAPSQVAPDCYHRQARRTFPSRLDVLIFLSVVAAALVAILSFVGVVTAPLPW